MTRKGLKAHNYIELREPVARNTSYKLAGAEGFKSQPNSQGLLLYSITNFFHNKNSKTNYSMIEQMKTLLKVFFLISLCTNCFAQGYKKTIKNSSGSYDYTKIKIDESNGKIIILSFTSFSILDFSANLISEKSFTRNVGWSIFGPSFPISTNMFVYSNGEFFGATNKPVIYLCDSTGIILWKHYYDIPGQFFSNCNNIVSTGDSNLLGVGVYNSLSSNNIIEPYFFKLNFSGNLLWAKRYIGLYSEAPVIAALSNSEYIMGMNLGSGCGTGICKIDSSGKVLWAKSYIRPRSMFYSSVIKNNTITFIGNPDTSHTVIGNVNYYSPYLFFLQVDTAGNIITAKQYGDSIHPLDKASIKATNDGGYIIITTIKVNNNTKLCIIKTDSIGNILWTRHHGGDFTNEIGLDVDIMPDSGYIALGKTDAPGAVNNYYLIKTDSLGFAGCQEYTDTIPVSTLNVTDSLITIYDSTLTVNEYTATVHDTVLPPSIINPGCNLALGINQNQSSYNKKTYSYPNPTQGRFQIKTGSTNTYMVTVTVYDTKGVQLFTKQYRNADDVKLDLTGYGKGVYSIRLTDNKTTRWSKVVVE